MTSIPSPSPNHNTRPAGTVVDAVVLHADAAPRAADSVSWIRSAKSKVSYHALIDRDGSVYAFVPPERRAWHAGVSEYKGRANVNDFSLGLAFANRNDGVEPYTDLQYQVGAVVVAEWMRRFPAVTPDRITTHAAIAPSRKTDPKGFDVPQFVALVKAEQEGANGR